MNDDPHSDEDVAAAGSGVTIDVRQLAALGRAAHERRRMTPAYGFLDLSDLVDEARRAGIEFRLERCGDPRPAPRSIVTCARRVVEIAVRSFEPPVTKRVDIHVCHAPGQIGLQVTASERRSYTRLRASGRGEATLNELSIWLGAFSPLYSLEPRRRDRANVAAMLPFESGSPWALLGCSHVQLVRPPRARR
jgi:hypothetical protein